MSPFSFDVHALPFEGSSDRDVLVVEVEESPDAPHQVLLPGVTKIPVRRLDMTATASPNEIERLINRREALRTSSVETMQIESFAGLFSGGLDGYGDPQRSPRSWRF